MIKANINSILILLTQNKKIYKIIKKIFKQRLRLNKNIFVEFCRTIFLDITVFPAYHENIRRYKKIKITKENIAQKIIPIEQIKEQGIIKLKNGTYIKIIKIIPINYELKSELEKKTILNSYKIFLKTCNFNLQILVQSKKENLEKQILILNEEKNQKKTSEEKEIFDNYIEYIKKTNFENKSSSKNFYIIIHQEDEFSRKNPNYDSESIIKENLNRKYFKIKENLSRCGNFVYELEKQETIDILYSFFNTRKSEKYS